MRKILAVLILAVGGVGVAQSSVVFRMMLEEVEGVRMDCPDVGAVPTWAVVDGIEDELEPMCGETYMGWAEFREAVREFRSAQPAFRLEPRGAWMANDVGFGQFNVVPLDNWLELWFVPEWFGERSSLVVWWDFPELE